LSKNAPVEADEPREVRRHRYPPAGVEDPLAVLSPLVAMSLEAMPGLSPRTRRIIFTIVTRFSV
jgi:hypothetical protein